VLGTKDADKLEKARKLFNTALEEDPDLFGAYYALARVDSATGDQSSALENYKKLTELRPNHIPSKTLLAITYERAGKVDEAAKVYRDILQKSPRFGPAANNLAWLLTDVLEGDLDEALNLAKVAKEILPNESSVADTLGWVYFKKGSPRAAITYIKEAVDLERSKGPGNKVNPEILYHLGETLNALGRKEEAKQALNEAIKVGGEKTPKYNRIQELLKELA